MLLVFTGITQLFKSLEVRVIAEGVNKQSHHLVTELVLLLKKEKIESKQDINILSSRQLIRGKQLS